MMKRLMLLAVAQWTPWTGELSWEWARPEGLWALALPALLWLLSRLRAQPPALATGTLALWKRVAASHPTRSSGRRQRTPPWAWCLIAALLLGALGLAGPRLVPPDPPRTWTVIVDHSPSTELLLPDGQSRLGWALDRARERLAADMRPGDRAVWISSAHGVYVPRDAELGPGELPPGRWLIHPDWFAPEPRWELFAAPGALWVTDALPETPAEQAGVLASGGAAVPGPISTAGTTRFVWDGVEILVEEGAQARRALLLAGTLPGPVAAMARLWAEERGLSVTTEPRRELALELRGEVESAAVEREVERDGWRARVSAAPGGLSPERQGAGDDGRDARAPRSSWLRALTPSGASISLVAASPGLVRLAFTEMTEPRGDPAAFALSWSRLFDAWMLPAPDVVPLAERGPAGERVERAGEPPPTPRPPVASGAGSVLRGDELDAWLAASAALLAALALGGGTTTRRAR